MASESFVKDIFRTFLNTLFKVIAIGAGIVVFFILFGTLFSGSGETPHSANPKVLPNDQWKMAAFSQQTPTILRINISGVVGLENIKKADIFKQLVESVDGNLKPGQVKAILLTINTPGGVADQADSIYRSLLEYKQRYKVPVYAYIEGLCASGGMYIACAADKIYASEDSLTGHVGVIFSPPFFNFSTLTEKLGIESKTFFAGKNKDCMDPFRPWKENEGAPFQYIVDSLYERFISIVSANRPKLTKEILIDQGARIWPTEEAIKYGYIDGSASSTSEVLKMLAKEVGIEENYQFVELETHGFLESLFGVRTGPLFGPVEHHIHLPGALHSELYGKPLYMYNQ